MHLAESEFKLFTRSPPSVIINAFPKIYLSSVFVLFDDLTWLGLLLEISVSMISLFLVDSSETGNLYVCVCVCTRVLCGFVRLCVCMCAVFACVCVHLCIHLCVWAESAHHNVFTRLTLLYPVCVHFLWNCSAVLWLSTILWSYCMP